MARRSAPLDRRAPHRKTGGYIIQRQGIRVAHAAANFGRRALMEKPICLHKHDLLKTGSKSNMSRENPLQ